MATQLACHIWWPQKSQCVGLSHSRSSRRSPWTPSSVPTFCASDHETMMGPSPAVPMTRPPRHPCPGKSQKVNGPACACTSDQHRGAAQTRGQRTKLSHSGKKERSSPVQGDHAVLGAVKASLPSFPPGSPPYDSALVCTEAQKGSTRSSKVFVKEQGEEELLRVLEVPDGHRAPAPPQNSRCDHPLLLEPGNLTSSPSMPLASIHSNKASSPGRPAFLEDGSPSPALAFAASPRPNHSCVFKREPPEGCERVRVFEEATSPGPDLACLTSCPDKNKVHFNRTGSAFCPVSLIKPLFSSMSSIFCHCPSSPGSPFPPASPKAPPRKDPEASKASSLPFEPRQRNPPSEESVLFQSSLVV